MKNILYIILLILAFLVMNNSIQHEIQKVRKEFYCSMYHHLTVGHGMISKDNEKIDNICNFKD